ncbi:MAG: TAXI family TRAP transporter solute-binding subunit [Pseudomonadales bacterium]
MTILLATLLYGCTYKEETLRFARYGLSGVDFLDEFQSLMELDTDVEIILDDMLETSEKLSALREGRLDLAMLENSAPYTDNVTAVMPIFRGVLHIMYRKDLVITGVKQLLRGRSVFVGDGKSPGARVLRSLTAHWGITENEYQLVDDIQSMPDVIMIFAPVIPKSHGLVREHYRLYSLNDVSDLEAGGSVQGIRFFFPQMEPYIIPASTYGAMNPEPVVTVGVDVLLVANANIAKLTIYRLMRTLVENKSLLANNMPILFDYMRDDFDVNRLNYPLHAGARAYVERNEPSFIERYAEVINVFFYFFVVLLSALFTFLRWQAQRKKDRIDEFYREVIAIKARVTAEDGEQSRQRAITELRELHDRAFALLIDEKLMADQSFQIFITICNSAIIDLQSRPHAGSLAH